MKLKNNFERLFLNKRHQLNILLNDSSLIKLDLGGIGKGKNGWTTVNLIPGVDIREDIINIDNYCRDNEVDIIKMSHTYEHIPIVLLDTFIKNLLRKLKINGLLIITQTDIKKVLEIYNQGKIDFYCLRDIIFSPINRRKENFMITSRDLLHHQFMWGEKELKTELLMFGFSRVESFNAGKWKFDIESTNRYQNNENYFDVKIPNLGIVAYK